MGLLSITRTGCEENPTILGILSAALLSEPPQVGFAFREGCIDFVQSAVRVDHLDNKGSPQLMIIHLNNHLKL